jgi:hypothetical protein
MLSVLLLLATNDGITLPPKPQLVRESDYAQVLRYAKLGEQGHVRWSLTGLRAMILEDGVTIGFESARPNAEVESAMRSAGTTWNRVLGRRVFKFASPGENPMLRVEVAGALTKGFSDHCLGLADFERQIEISESAAKYALKGRISVVRTHHGRTLSAGQLSEVFVHELGHVLGLDDEEKLIGAMSRFDLESPRQGPSQSEIETVSLYRGIVKAVIQRVSTLDKSR